MTTENLCVIAHFEIQIKKYEDYAKTLPNEGLQKIYSDKALWLAKLLNIVKGQVKYAKWEYNGGDIGYSDYSCSNCQNSIVFDDNNDLYPYCPYCGAKMNKC